MKLLLVEDNESDAQVCKSSSKVYETKNSVDVEIVWCESVEDSIGELNSNFDGVIIDLKLASKGDEGLEIIKTMTEEFYFIPIFVFTGTPENIGEYAYIRVGKKGETKWPEIFDYMFASYKTGMTKIFGGRGLIASSLNEIFWNNILPHIDSWKDIDVSPKNAEKAMLRYTINHLNELLDKEPDFYLPEEMYINPPVSKNIATGSVVKQKDDGDYYVILNPSCDLAVRSGGEFNTNYILVCHIESIQDLIADATSNTKKKSLQKLFKNNSCLYKHWLPPIDGFHGGIINFRKVSSFKKDVFFTLYDQPFLKISSHFIKDINSRFSTYYSRQGQPDFNAEKLVEKLTAGNN